MLKIRLNINKVDKLIFSLLMLQLLVLGFFELNTLMNKVLTVIILGWLYIRKAKPNSSVFIRIGCICTLFLISALCSEKFTVSNAIRNLATQLYPFIYAYYFAYLTEKNPQILDAVLKDGFGWINLAFIANCIALTFQIILPGSIVGYHTIADKALLVDTYSGFFIYGMTHTLCIFFSFVLIYNLAYGRIIRRPFVRKLLHLYDILIFVVCIILGVFYDNKAFLFILPVGLTVYAIIANKGRLSAQKLVLILICIFAFILAYILIPSVQTFLYDNILRRIDMLFLSWSGGSRIEGSNERTAMLGYALTNLRTYLMGTGWGSSYIYTSGYLGFLHFGQSDLGPIMLLGGIWYLILCIGYYHQIYTRIVCKNQKISNLVVKLAILVQYIVCLLYTQPNTATEVQLTVLLLMLAFRFRNTDDQKIADGWNKT